MEELDQWMLEVVADQKGARLVVPAELEDDLLSWAREWDVEVAPGQADPTFEVTIRVRRMSK